MRWGSGSIQATRGHIVLMRLAAAQASQAQRQKFL